MECQNCGGSCRSCDGCGALELNRGEIAVLEQLRSIPFWPVARKAHDDVPVCARMAALGMVELSLILQCLEKKGLISLDYDMPLKGFDYSELEGCPVHGSFALTLRGQQVLDLLEIQGAGM